MSMILVRFIVLENVVDVRAHSEHHDLALAAVDPSLEGHQEADLGARR